MPDSTTPEQRQELLELAENIDLPYTEPPWNSNVGRRYIFAAANLAPGLARDVERLEKAIEAAPHGATCTVGVVLCKCGERQHVHRGTLLFCPYKDGGETWAPEAMPCNCWKAALAAGEEKKR